MKSDSPLEPVIFTLFGSAGDLSARLIVPALFNLFLDGRLPERFVLLGADRHGHDAKALAEQFHDAVARHSRRGKPEKAAWARFAEAVQHQRLDATDADDFKGLHETLQAIEKRWGERAEHVFYLATPPSLFIPIARNLGRAGLARDRKRARIVVEKPLGRDLDSSREINVALADAFEERQTFRIDHFLGKETVQNILALRFANPMFEPVWNRRYVDHVAITVAETLGVERRGGYYEQAGALRDMVQNHLFQLLCLVAMEAPVAYDADDIRNKKLDVLRALRPIPREAVGEFAARGQYDAGWIDGEAVGAYRDEPGVAGDSNTETYAALKLHVDNWRWQGVPFYLRTGKRLTAQVSEISIRFRDVPHRAFPAEVGLNAQPARLVIQIQPEQGIVFKFTAKEPGSRLRLHPVNMRFCYADAFNLPAPDAYETLLWDVMRGDPTLFMRADQVEAAWQILMPVIEAWEENPAPDFPNYAAGSWGPEAAAVLVAGDGNNWLTPTLSDRRGSYCAVDRS